jgi:hypothetical protein
MGLPMSERSAERFLSVLAGTLRRSRRLSRDERALAWEALRELVRAFVLVRVLGWTRYSRILGQARPGDPEWAWDGDPETPRVVGRAVERWHRLAPRAATCLIRSLAAQRMLVRRDVPSALVLGLRRDSEARSLGAHGWLRVGQEVVIGRKEMGGHHAVAHFRS